MNYNRKERWTAKQIQFLHENYNKMSDEAIASIIGRTHKSVTLKRQRMDIDKTGFLKDEVRNKAE